MENKEFDSFAGNYRSLHTQNVHGVSGADSDYFSEYKIKELAERNIIPSNAFWLDFGCGDGNTARFVRKYFPESRYSGIDVSDESICAAKKQFPQDDPNLEFKAYDGNIIPYDDNTFDIIFIACVMHHILPENRESTLNECRRVLKKDGKIIIFEHNPLNPLTVKLVNTCPFDENAILLTNRTCRNLLKENGLHICKARYTIFMPRKGIFKKIIKAEKFLTHIPFGGQYYIIAGK